MPAASTSSIERLPSHRMKAERCRGVSRTERSFNVC